MMGFLAGLLSLVVVCLSVTPTAADTLSAALQAELAAAKAGGCAGPTDVLGRVLCAGALRVGVRTSYPGFGMLRDETYSGYDIGVALAITRRLGLRMEPVPVTPANRIEMVASGAIDVVIATMGFSVTRQKQVRFVGPAYYASHTAVIGPRHYLLPNDNSIAGQTVCVPLGNVSNTILAGRHARLMIFDDPRQLIDALTFSRCSLVAHDNTYFASNMADRGFAARFEEKLALSPTPWGIAVAPKGADALQRVLSLTITDMHRPGVLSDLARKNQVDDGFLRQQQSVWAEPDCILPTGYPAPACMPQPIADSDAPSSIAPWVRRVEAWIHNNTGVAISLPMLTGQQGLTLFLEGIVNTIVLVIGSITATLGFALLFLFGLSSGRAPLATATLAFVTLLQSSPVVLLLMLGFYIMTAVLTYDATVALIAAIIVLGLSNGSNAGAAMADAAVSLVKETPGRSPTTAAVMRRSVTQVTSFAVNAARGSAVASFIGTPELLTALTDIASVSTERKTTYAILLLFYLGIVALVVWLSAVLTRRFAMTGVEA